MVENMTMPQIYEYLNIIKIIQDNIDEHVIKQGDIIFEQKVAIYQCEFENFKLKSKLNKKIEYLKQIKLEKQLNSKKQEWIKYFV